jgi:hypothetical protein
MSLKKDPEDTLSPRSSVTGSSERDENYEFYKQHQGIEYTRQEAKRVLRKIDIRLIPLLFLIYMLQVRIKYISLFWSEVLIPRSTWTRTALTSLPSTA